MALAAARSYPRPAPESLVDDFAAVDATYRPRLVRYATRCFGATDADDIAQETLVRAWSSRNPSGGRDPWPWLRAVALNVGRDMLRAQAHRPCTSEDSDPDLATTVDTQADPYDIALALDAARRVAVTVEGLPDQQRRILILTAVDRLPCSAVAELLQITQNAVRQSLLKARRRAAQELQSLSGSTRGLLGLPVFAIPALVRRMRRLLHSGGTPVGAMVASSLAVGAFIAAVELPAGGSPVSAAPVRSDVQTRAELASTTVGGTTTAAPPARSITTTQVLAVASQPALHQNAPTPPADLPGRPTVLAQVAGDPFTDPHPAHVQVEVPTQVGTATIDITVDAGPGNGVLCTVAGVVSCS